MILNIIRILFNKYQFQFYKIIIDKKQLYESIMTSASKEVKKALVNSELNESRTSNRDIENYIKSWIKWPSDSKEMYERNV